MGTQCVWSRRRRVYACQRRLKQWHHQRRKMKFSEEKVRLNPVFGPGRTESSLRWTILDVVGLAGQGS